MLSIARIQLVVAAVLVPGALALAQPALATDYCVAPNDTCGGVKLQDFQAALNAAAVDTAPDRIFLGAKTYLAPAQGFVYDPLPAGPVEIAGTGRGQTKLTGTSGAYRTLAVFGGQATSVHDLSIVMPPNAPAGAQALRTNGVVKNVSVDDDPTELNVDRTGVVFTGPGRLEDSDVFMSQNHHTTAVVLAPGATLRNTNVFAYTGITSNGGTIDRAVIDGLLAGVEVHHGATKLTSTAINTYGYGSVGIGGETTDGDSSLTVDGATIIGPFDAGSGTGINAGNVYAPTAKVDVVVTNSVIRGYPSSLWFDAAGPGYVHASASYSDYDSSGDVASGPNATLTEAHISNVDRVGFKDIESGTLLAGSPLTDAGDPTTAQGLDVLGNALVTDGDGDGVARRDIGAYELAGVPFVPGAGPAPVSGDNQGAAPPSALAATDTLAPALSGLRITHKVFAVGRARTAVSARAGRGTRFSYRLSEAAKVVITVQRVGAKRRAGKLTRVAKVGANSLSFSGRVGAKALKPGRYRAVVTATDAAGNRSAKKSVAFRIVRR